jgi:UDP-2-acetamido-3-amino-2,3-dideoxy-glucuronate N-acetyltransferase
VGEFAFIGAGALVNKNVPDYGLMVGVPAKQVGWMSVFGEQLDLPLQGHTEAICGQSGDKYILDGKSLFRMQK